MPERGAGAVSARDIGERGDVGRPTFYLPFADEENSLLSS
jgi:hypothetical protein